MEFNRSYKEAMTVADLSSMIREAADQLGIVPTIIKTNNPLKIVIKDDMGRVHSVTGICRAEFDTDCNENTFTFIENGYSDGEESFNFKKEEK